MAGAATDIPQPLRKVKKRRRKNQDSEIRQSARQIYQQGMADAMKAAALLVCSRKLDEIRTILLGAGLSGVIPAGSIATLQQATQPSPVQAVPPPITNPCKHCGRPGVYKSKPSQWDRTGSWFCRAHAVLGTSVEAEDRFDRSMNMGSGPPPVGPAIAPQPVTPQQFRSSPGASSIQEALGNAELVEEPNG